MQRKPDDVIVTYGEEWTVGREMLLRKFMERGGLVTHICACCRIAFWPKADELNIFECPECRNDPNARQAYS